MSTNRILKPIRLLLLGAPGSGKGTQTSRLLRDFPQIYSISSGDLLRREIKLGTAIGKKYSSIIESGGLVPDSSIVELIKRELILKSTSPTGESTKSSSSPSWLLDGFPRTLNQAKMLDKMLLEEDLKNNSNNDWTYSSSPETKQNSLNLVVELDVPESVILERIENRWVHVPSGRVYNLTFNPPKVPGKDDVTGEPLSKRPDDNPETFKERIDVYKSETLPLLDYYEERGIVRKVQGETSDIIYPKLKELILKEFS